MPVTIRFLWVLALVWPVFATAARDDALRVYVSIEPLQYLVERVGGEHVQVEVVVEAGRRPETYEPSPRQVAALAEADVFFGAGMPLEAAWRRQLNEGSSAPEWVDLAAGLSAPPGVASGARGLRRTAGGAAHDHHDGIDPHTWLSPLNAQQMASIISGVLARLDPGNRGVFRAGAAALRDDLESLHRDIAATLAQSDVEAFLVFHPAWGHFARTYGLAQISIESGGKEPGTRGMVKVIHAAKKAGIRTIFVDPRHSPRIARTVADAIGGRIEVLDPLSYDLVDNLRRAAHAIADSRS